MGVGVAAVLQAAGDGEEPRARFAARMQALWQAAGEPDLNAVAAASGLRSRQGRAAGGLISAWKNGDHVPDRWERLQPVLADLEVRARRRGSGRCPSGVGLTRHGEPDWAVWKGWWAAARGASRRPVPASERNGSERLPPAVHALMQRHHVAAEALPYPLYEGSLPQLSQVYVRQLLRRPTDPTDGSPPVDAGREASSPPLPPVLRPIEAVLDTEPRHLLVVAGPGGGKSTLTLRLSGELARRWLDGERPAPGFAPLHITASQLARDGGLTAVLEQVTACRTADTANGREGWPPPPALWLVLVDGIDEITDAASRRALIGQLAALAGAPDTTMRLLVTTRPLPVPEMDALRRAGFARYLLDPFDPEDLEDFAERWFALGTTAPGTARAYLTQIARSGLRELARVPLLATITAMIFEAAPEHPLPSSRYRLYEQYRAYLARTEEAHGLAAWRRLLQDADRVGDRLWQPGADVNTTAAARALRDGLLHRLAVEATTKDSGALLTTAWNWLGERLGTRLAASVAGWTEKTAAALVGTGLIVRRHDAEVEFVHASIAEHLAAEYFATRLPPSFSPASPSWEEALLKARHHDLDRAVLLQYTHHRPAAGAELLDWLLDHRAAGQKLAGALLADGARGETRHYARFLSTLPAPVRTGPLRLVATGRRALAPTRRRVPGQARAPPGTAPATGSVGAVRQAPTEGCRCRPGPPHGARR
ncbi:hypothetical protein GCM10010278_78420 [Streptomyces melanogenes]|nr:hypothetical protein GCM10010278_78420 [Streptomyces melanogenes]